MKLFNAINNKNEGTDSIDPIRNRNSWLFIIIIGAFSLLLFYKIATSPFVFRFADFISVFCSLFAIAISIIYFNKVNKLEQLLKSYTSAEKPVQRTVLQEEEQPVVPDQLAFFEEDKDKDEIEEVLEDKTEDNTEEVPEKEAEEEIEPEITEDLWETKRIKEEELAKIEMDKTQLYKELYTRAQLSEEEQQYFNNQIREKETETYQTKVELNQFKDRFQQMIKKTPQLFQKRDSRIEGIVRMLNPVTLTNASLEDLNQRLDQIIDVIPSETLESLVRDGYLDEHYHLTRSGYREFMHVNKTFQ